MLRSGLYDYSDVFIVVKGTITVADPNNANNDKKLALKIMLHLLLAFQNKIIHSI